MSTLRIGASVWPAFSGFGDNRNRRSAMCVASSGPIPEGRYYVITRQSDGGLGAVRDMFNGHADWFALYADDGQLDDETLCENAKRGSFRLHPGGRGGGFSLGCITIPEKSHFMMISQLLHKATAGTIHGSQLAPFEAIDVR